MSLDLFGATAVGRGRRIALGAACAALLWASSVSAAAADSDISTGLAYVAAPGQGATLAGMSVTNGGPDPAAGVTLAGTVPSSDNDGHPVDWQIFTNRAAISEPFGPFAKFGTLAGPPYGADPCTFTSGTEYRCDIGPLAVGETRTVVFNPTWEESNTAPTPTKWGGFSYTAALVGGADPEPANNDNEFNFIENGFYYAESTFGLGGATNDLHVVEQSPPASGAYEPGATVTLEITSTLPTNGAAGSVSVVVPDPDGVTCSGDGVCLSGGPQALTGPPNRVLVAMAGPPLPGGGWPAPPTSSDPVAFTTLLSAKLPGAVPAGCAPGKTAPYTFDATQQPVGSGSGLFSTAIVKLPLTVQVQCPTSPSSNPPSTQPADPPPAVRPPAARHKGPHRAGRGRLQLTKVASRSHLHAGERLSYRITVRNVGKSAGRGVRVCDQLPAGLALVGSQPRGKVSKGRLCWRIESLGPRHGKAFRVAVRALRGSAGRKVNRVTASAANAGSARATSAVRVTAVPAAPTPVTG